jgi:hypothetical protein
MASLLNLSLNQHSRKYSERPGNSGGSAVSQCLAPGGCPGHSCGNETGKHNGGGELSQPQAEVQPPDSSTRETIMGSGGSRADTVQSCRFQPQHPFIHKHALIHFCKDS